MAVHIQRLTCRVNARTRCQQEKLHPPEPPKRPAMAFVMPLPEPEPDAGREPSEMVTEAESEKRRHGEPVPVPSKTDPRAVADRVYELMLEEVHVGRLRGGGH